MTSAVVPAHIDAKPIQAPTPAALGQSDNKHQVKVVQAKEQTKEQAKEQGKEQANNAWPRDQKAAIRALYDRDWMIENMSGDTRTMDELLEMAKFTVADMQNFVNQTQWGLLPRHWKLAIDYSPTDNAKKVYLTPPYLGRFDRGAVLGARAKEIASGTGAPIQVSLADLNPPSAMAIAKKEFEENKCPMQIVRELPGGKTEILLVSDLFKVDD